MIRLAVACLLLAGCATLQPQECAIGTAIVLVPVAAVYNTAAGKPFNAYMKGE